MDFLATARFSGFSEAELTIIFNTFLDEPLDPAEMRQLRTGRFEDLVKILLERQWSRDLSGADPPTGSVTI
ncbi:MAG: hypothetical protein ACRC9V_08780, partial [Aeromonas sp.]